MTALLLGLLTAALVTTILYIAHDRIERRRARRKAARPQPVATKVFQPQGEPSLPPAPAWSDAWLTASERKGL